jgi:hypothetical protein
MLVEHRQFFVPFTKVDKEKRIVWGIAQTEEPDSQDDLLTYEASVDAFQKWQGNIREMHDPKAVGSAVRIICDPVARKIMVGSYISKGAEDTWQKILDGTLRGYSIGGGVVNGTREFIKRLGRSVRKVTAYVLDELSLVDTPANSHCVITAVQKRGSTLVATDVLGAAPIARVASDVLSQTHGVGNMKNALKKRAKIKTLVPFAKSLGDKDELIVARVSDFTKAANGDFLLAKSASVQKLTKGDLEGDGYMDDADEAPEEAPVVDLQGHAENAALMHKDLCKMAGLDHEQHYADVTDEDEDEDGEGTGEGEPGESMGKNFRARGRRISKRHTARSNKSDVEKIVGSIVGPLAKSIDGLNAKIETLQAGPAARRDSTEGTVLQKNAADGTAEPSDLDAKLGELKKAFESRDAMLEKGVRTPDERRAGEQLAKKIATLEGEVKYIRNGGSL